MSCGSSLTSLEEQDQQPGEHGGTADPAEPPQRPHASLSIALLRAGASISANAGTCTKLK